ncbi:MFS transporter [Streptomyces sp. NPDC006658]|uniref:MFS transporter n=1 Tax=Streptomyces sp. NPDC006658 TaxID=3156900 RepID=UPI0034068F38
MSTSANPSAVDASDDRHATTRAGRHPGIVLTLLVTCYLMITVDNTVVTIALPQIRDSLGFSPTGLSWVLSAYTLTFGGLLLLGGRAGDVFGHRRTFVWGVWLFTVCSLLGGLATEPWMLLAARAVQGVGAAIASPGGMSLLITNFKEGPARNRALAVYSTLAGLGMATGMILGGVLTEWASWRWVLFVNVPFGLAVALLTPRYVTGSRPHPGRLDLVGAFTGTAGMSGLVYGFIRVGSDGWSDPLALAAFAVGVVLLTVFLTLQTRADTPLLPLGLFANRNRAAGYATVLLSMATLFSALFFISQFLQGPLHFSPVRAGLAFLPMALGMFGMSRVTPKLLPLLGARVLITAGIVLVTAGALWLSRLTADSSYALGIAGPTVLLGIGIGSFLMPLNALILSGVPPREAGAASGTMQTMQQVGGALGLAVLVTVYGTALGGSRTSRALAHATADAFIGATVFAAAGLLLVLTAIRVPKPQAPSAAQDS